MQHDVEDRPWKPAQIFAMSFLFGAGGGGVAAGINFKRLGQPQLQMICGGAGFAVFIVGALVIFRYAPESAYRPAAMLFNVLTGLAFMFIQKPYFEAWQAEHYDSAAARKAYRPNRTGLLFLTGFVCLAVEVGILFAISSMLDT